MNSLAPEAPRTEPLAEWEEARYLDQVFTRTLRNERKFLVVDLMNAEFLRIWLLGRGRDVGLHVRSHKTYGGVSVIVFERGIESQEEHPRDTAR